MGRRAEMRSVALLLAVAVLHAAQNPVAWSFKTTPKKPVKAGDNFALRLVARIEPGWHLYSIDQPPGGPVATEISLATGAPFEMGAVTGPKPHVLFDSNFDMQVGVYAGGAECYLPVKVAPDASTGRRTVVAPAHDQSCNDKPCLLP